MECLLLSLHFPHQAIVSVDLVAPRALGRHRVYFQLQTAQGAAFGPRMFLEIVVKVR